MEGLPSSEGGSVSLRVGTSCIELNHCELLMQGIPTSKSIKKWRELFWLYTSNRMGNVGSADRICLLIFIGYGHGGMLYSQSRKVDDLKGIFWS